MTTTCPNCQTEYQNVSQHWTTAKSCDIPPLDDDLLDLATGLTLGDGCIERPADGNPRLVVEMTTRDYLEHVADRFGVFGLDVTERGPRGSFESDQPIYRFTTRRHPDFAPLAAWYGEDGKRFPADLRLNPQMLRAWYVADGHLADSRGTRYILLAAANEIHRDDYLVGLFEDIGFHPSVNGHRLQFPAAETGDLLAYMGEVPPGFAYKFEVMF